MADTTSTMEKIYCTPSGCDNAATMMALMNNQNQWNNNPFIYLVWLMMMRYWNNGDFGYGYNANNSAINTASIQDQLAAFRNQMSDNQNSNQLMDAIAGNASDIRSLADRIGCDYNALSSAISNVRAGIDSVAGQVGFSSERVINAVNLGDAGITSTLQSCCCENKLMSQAQGYENRIALAEQTGILGSKMDANHSADALQSCNYHGQVINRIDQLANGVTQGFASIGYQNSKDTGDIITAINAAQQRTADQLSTHWQAETSQALQDAKFEVSQLKQNQYLHSLLTSGNSNNSGCGCGGF